jgi:hypothetical protein
MILNDEQFYDHVYKQLVTGDARVVFTKKDGTERTMLCTLTNIPAVHQPKNETDKEYSKEVLRVFDTENQGWRSFRLDSIISVQAV